ncbi:MAG: Vibriobactin utilization protein ViuB [Acidimicrobiales bacterium AG-410-I20]|nr:MAG: Vibriobactin utilization protein ViuB [Acidimicrobiales bacterium AG-410-I20]
MYAEVKKITKISPNMVRIVFGDGDLSNFESTSFTDQYINAYFVPEEANYSVPFDLEHARASGDAYRPRPRRFTVRQWEPETEQLTIDFVTHGDKGYAGIWAQRATIGDRLQFKGPNGSYAPADEVDWHLLAGDESALPAISASVETISDSKPCIVFLIVDGPENQIDFSSSPIHEINWVYRSEAIDPETALLEAIREHQFQEGEFDVFIHGEAGEVRAIRKHLILERGVNIENASISPYWRRDHTDETWRSIKKQWLADQENDI